MVKVELLFDNVSLCVRCDRGYWGNPNVLDGGCKPCDCSGNIDIDDPTSCDIETGECVKCTHNTAGERCERCKDWFYGDAIDLKNCKRTSLPLPVKL
jgi:laminin alpha 3/5